jgi:23S rRNA pseudouridine2457 synthase
MARILAFNKPYEVLSQFTDPAGRQTLQAFIGVKGVYPAGRLDYRSEGLLLLADDGELIHRLTDPRFEHFKTYLAQVEGEITQEAIQRMRSEILLPGLQTRLPEVQAVAPPDIPPRPVPVRDYHPTSWLHIRLTEGKKHQVRRMTAAAGFPTLRLVRVAIGPIELGGLLPGVWRELSQGEIQALRSELEL